MEKLYLICNAHLDPIWQWTWDEGAAEALSTFRSAADLLDGYDFIFNHNERLLYEYIEEYDPVLFERIRKHVADGKWKIIGGWFLQPDELMPKGESLARQILYGKLYFKEKFGEKGLSDTAFSVDAFGHSRGLVQILKKCGQKNYITVRPFVKQLSLPSECFIWRGYDGSEVKAIRTSAYCTFLGKAGEQIKDYIRDHYTEKTGLKLWGVGNHGGGPSRKDLDDIKKVEQETGVEVVHSYAEEVFENFDFAEVFDRSLISCMPGCYSSVSEIKQKHLRLENLLYSTEKMATAAYLRFPDYVYPEKELFSACKTMLESEFHDVLSGTTIKSGATDAVEMMDGAIADLKKIRAKTLFFFARTLEKTAGGEYCVAVYNYMPYEHEENVEFEFTMEKNSDKRFTPDIRVYDEDGAELLTQIIKERSNVSIDCRKRIVAAVKLKPLCIKRLRVTARLIENVPKDIDAPDFSVRTDYYKAEIDTKTGLLSKLEYRKTNYLKKDGFGLYVYDDNEDPWAMADEQLTHLGDNMRRVGLDYFPRGIFDGLSSLRVVEDGSILKRIEGIFYLDGSSFVINYLFWKNRPYFDVKIKVFWLARNKILKLHIPLANYGDFVGQQVFGKENLATDGKECVAQRYVYYGSGEKVFGVLNDCSYACSFTKDTLKLTLLRAATYCAHPVDNEPIVNYDRYLDITDAGENDFTFRIGEFTPDELERRSLEMNEPPYALALFPTGDMPINDNGKTVSLSDERVALIALKKKYGGEEVILRLFNNSKTPAKTTLTVGAAEKTLSFGAYEVKTVVYSGETIDETYEMQI